MLCCHVCSDTAAPAAGGGGVHAGVKIFELISFIFLRRLCSFWINTQAFNADHPKAFAG